MARILLLACATSLTMLMGALDAAADTKLRCRADHGETAYFINPTPGYEHDRYGTAPRELIFQFGAFVASFDTDDDDDGDGTDDFLAVPHWVAYEIKRYGPGPVFEGPKPSPARPSPWYEMSELAFLASQSGVTKDDIDDSYSGFGISPGAPALGGKLVNRGHLAMKAHAQRIGWRQACNTHVFVNAVPQQMEMNQGDWSDLEAYSGAAANKFGRVWVIAGPVWDNGQSIGSIGHSDTIPVAVPAGLFKILVKENPSEKLPDVLAFIYRQPRDDYVLCSGTSTYDHTDFLVSVADIEAQTGLDFLRNVKFKNVAERTQFKAQKATALWPVEANFYGFKCAS